MAPWRRNNPENQVDSNSTMAKSGNGKVTPKAARAVVPGDDVTPTSTGDVAPPLVTPSTTAASRRDNDAEDTPTSTSRARRALFSPTKSAVEGSLSLVTPQSSKRKPEEKEIDDVVAPPSKRRLIFGKEVALITCQPNVERVYKIVKRLTGSIGGNGYVGPIYGELTMGSMQKMINLMIEHCGLDANSRFIDVGSGIGKPNLHVAQYPGVSFSCGVEVEQTRWALGLSCLKAVLDAAVDQQANDAEISEACCIRGNTVFLHTDITEAHTFDPFTHVYMFSIGFPPPLWLKLSDMWNRSEATYLICYHSPKDIVHSYEFDAELIAQMQTSMHGSKEGHMGYIYKRTTSNRKSQRPSCDPLFKESLDLVNNGLFELQRNVAVQFEETMEGGRRTRSRR